MKTASGAPMRNIRVAVLFFGIPRCSEICVPSIQERVLDPLKSMGSSVSVECMFHLYRQDWVENPRSGESGVLDPANYEWFTRQRGMFADPDETLSDTEYQKFLAYGDSWEDGGISLRNLLLQLKSLQHLTATFEKGDFDVALFLRPDLDYHDPLPVEAIAYAAEHPDACIVPCWQWCGGANDRFAICGRTAALAYGNRVVRAEEFCRVSKSPLHSEALLTYQIHKHALRLRTMAVRASRIRISGKTKEEDFRTFGSMVGGWGMKLQMCYLKAISF
jgi:hypothetical protein